MKAGRVICVFKVLLFWIATMALLAVASGKASTSIILIGAITAPARFALTLLFIKWERASLSDFGIVLSWGSARRFGFGMLIGFGLIAAHTMLLALAGGIHWASAPERLARIPCAIIGYLLLAAREELAFHGYPLRELVPEIKPWGALIFVSVLFAIEHRVGGASWVNALMGSTTGSLVFGMAAVVTRGLALPIGLHAAWNIGDWLRGGKDDTAPWRMIVDPASTSHAAVWAMTSYVLVMALALIVLSGWRSDRIKTMLTGCGAC